MGNHVGEINDVVCVRITFRLQVGRHHFRIFLRGIHAEENLRFWEAVVEFRAVKNKSPAMVNLARVIMQTYLAEGASNEVFLPFGVRQVIQKRLDDNDIDLVLFDDAIKHVEQVLRYRSLFSFDLLNPK